MSGDHPLKNYFRILLAALLTTMAGYSLADRDCGAEFRRDKVVCDMRQDFVCLRRAFDESQRCFAEQEEQIERENARAEQEKARRAAEQQRAQQSAQTNSSGQFVDINAGACKLRFTETTAASLQSRGQKIVWTGPCSGGYAHGQGLEREHYPDGRLNSIGKLQRNNGVVVRGSFDGYTFFNGQNKYKYNKPGEQGIDIPPSQIPEWAREVVDGKERPAPVLTAQTPVAPATSSTNSNSSSQSQSFNSGGAARLPLRAAFRFNLDVSRPWNKEPALPMVSVIAGNSESELKRNAEALIRDWATSSAWTFDSVEIIQVCNGPGYVVQARINWRTSGQTGKSEDIYGSCFNTDDPIKIASQIKAEVKRRMDSHAGLSEWGYGYFAFGYVGANNFRTAGQYAGAMGTRNYEFPIQILLDRRNVSFDCNDQKNNNDPRLDNMEACLSSGMRAIKN